MCFQLIDRGEPGGGLPRSLPRGRGHVRRPSPPTTPFCVRWHTNELRGCELHLPGASAPLPSPRGLMPGLAIDGGDGGREIPGEHDGVSGTRYVWQTWTAYGVDQLGISYQITSQQESGSGRPVENHLHVLSARWTDHTAQGVFVLPLSWYKHVRDQNPSSQRPPGQVTSSSGPILRIY
ncbi:hypothetical protein DPEC_G00214980 [Dallia pectoralis]|uniref:Uncharacterized protein n=1 Tax=Dallia pectoralis TaxID=75939 RepID=A0ACC2G2H1_DALPE|nr:hypothetical protein DPEC_G00214980 [Dallia pectoralis]